MKCLIAMMAYIICSQTAFSAQNLVFDTQKLGWDYLHSPKISPRNQYIFVYGKKKTLRAILKRSLATTESFHEDTLIEKACSNQEAAKKESSVKNAICFMRYESQGQSYAQYVFVNRLKKSDFYWNTVTFYGATPSDQKESLALVQYLKGQIHE